MRRIVAFAVTFSFAAPVSAGTNGLLFLNAVPTLDEIGLGALIALVAWVAGWAVRRRTRR